MLATVDSLKPVVFRKFSEPRGVLVAIDLPQAIPFGVARFFWIFDVPAGGTRGSHAHKRCHQYLVCAAGSLRVDALDGRSERQIQLKAGHALHIPPCILTTEHFETAGTILMVFCDKPYDVNDYLNSADELIQYRRHAFDAR